MTVAPPLLLSDTRDRVATLTLNRPHVLNSLTDPLLGELRDALQAADADNGVRAIVITGAGRAFCAGQDLTVTDTWGALDVAAHLHDYYAPVITAIRATGKPVIAAVNGVAAGAGLSLALACDMRVAAESATFIQAFVRIGLVPDAGGSFFLPRLVGLAKATEMAMLGDTVNAPDALRCGLVNRVVADADLAAATQELAARLARGPRSLAAIKRLLDQSLNTDLAAQMAHEEAAQIAAAATHDFIEGVTAFAEKRQPVFTGQ